jgi:hypothetical protein
MFLRNLSVGSLLVLTAVATAAPGQEKPPATRTFHVAPDGKDSQPGTADRPFAKLERARGAVRALRREQGGALKQPVTVLVSGGTFRLTGPSS